MHIDRRQFLALSSTALTLAPIGRAMAQGQQTPPAGASPQAAPPQAAPPAVPKFDVVRRNVGTFTMRGGTIGTLINKGGVLVVDTQYPDTARTCLDGLKEKTGNRGIDIVFNTHHHADHTGGNAVFRAEAKRLIAQANVPDLQRKVAAATANAPAPTVADATFDKAWSEDLGDEKVTAWFNGPGHTGGDAIIHFERAHVVHMGDLLFHERHPRVDRPAGASIQNWIVILAKVAKDMPADTIYIAGHARDGAPVAVDRKALLHFRDYLDAVLTLTKKGIAAGQTKDAIAATTTLPGFESYQGGGALTLGGVLTSAYEELTAK